jgi:hypothetical protein
MSSIHADPRLRNKRHYIAAEAFNSFFYSYSTSMDPTTYVTTGSLGPVAGASASNCPQGRILREIGKRLYPDAHPGISTMMVGVYDANSGLNGYIDPNAPHFAVFNSDKPVEIVDGGDNNTTVPHKGQPVYTTGDIITSAGDITAQTGDITATAGEVTALGQVRSTGVTDLGAISGTTPVTKTINLSLGQVFYVQSTPGVGGLALTIQVNSLLPGARFTLIISQQNTNATTITFGTNIFSAGTYAPNTAAIYTISFVCDGNNFVETSRTGAQS